MLGSLFIVFLFITNMAVEYITRYAFKTVVTDSGYDDMDFFSAAGAFYNCAMAACYIPSLFLAALIVKDRPLSSYFSSMGGWRWKIFFRSLAVGFVIFGIPNIIHVVLMGKTSGIRFTPGGFIVLALLLPLQGLSEELLYRSFTMQTAGSWFKIPLIGMIAQILFFALTHPYNMIGRIYIALSALIYGLLCVFTRGIETSTALHILNNATGIFMVGFGFGTISSEQTLPDSFFDLFIKLLFFLFILYMDRKYQCFKEVQRDDITAFNEKSR